MDRITTKTYHTSTWPRFVISALSALLLTTCSNPVDLKETIEVDLMKSNGRFLEILSITAPETEGRINPTDTIEIKFDRPVDVDSITPGTLIVRPEGGVSFDYDLRGISYVSSSNTIRLRVYPFLPIDTDISVIVSGIKGQDGSIIHDIKSRTWKTSIIFAGSIMAVSGNDATSTAGYTKTDSVDFTVQMNDLFNYFKYKVSTDDGITWSELRPTSYVNLGSYPDRIFPIPGCVLNGISEGSVTVKLKFFGDLDGAGEPTAGTEDETTILYDPTPPPAPSTPDLDSSDDSGISNTDNLTNQSTALTFSGTAEASTTVTLYNGAALLKSVAADGGGNWTTDLSLGAGSYSITAHATDAAGNTGAASGALAVIVDTAPPGIPSVPDLATDDDTGISNTDNRTTKTELTFSGTAEPNSTVRLYSGGIVWGSSTANGGGAWTAELSLPAGSFYFTAQVSDAAGNSSTSTVLALVVDFSPPPAPSIPDLASADDSGISSTDNITNKTTGLTFSGSAEAYSTVTLYNGASILGSYTTGSNGTWTMDLALAAGPYTITAKAADQTGNVGSLSAGLALTIDITPPAAPVFTSGTTSTSRNPVWSWTSGGGGGGYSYYYSPTSGPWTLTTSTSFTAPTALADGTYSLTLEEKDIAGNPAPTAARSITVNALPSPPNVSATTPTVDNTPTWTWTTGSYGNGTYRYQLDTGLWTTTTAQTFTPATLSDGTHTLNVQVQDAGGEWSISTTKAVAVSPLLPVSGSIGLPLKPTLQCRGILLAISYEWYIGVGTPVKVLTTTITTATASQNLASYTTYNWYVIAKAKSGDTRLPSSGYFTFKTILSK